MLRRHKISISYEDRLSQGITLSKETDIQMMASPDISSYVCQDASGMKATVTVQDRGALTNVKLECNCTSFIANSGFEKPCAHVFALVFKFDLWQYLFRHFAEISRYCSEQSQKPQPSKQVLYPDTVADLEYESSFCNETVTNSNLSESKSHKCDPRKSTSTVVTRSTTMHSRRERDNREKLDVSIRISPREALKVYKNVLTADEKIEIRSYKDVYCVGHFAEKSRSGVCNRRRDRYSRSLIISTHDHIAYRYEALRLIRKHDTHHSFVVFDHKHREKRILKCFRSDRKSKEFAEHETEDQGAALNTLSDSFVFRKHNCLIYNY